MEFDLHIHTSRYSGCSTIEPVSLIAKARETGLHGIALTEHGIRWRDDDIRELVEKSGYGDLLVIPGQEAACYSRRGLFQGEFLVFGFHRSLGSNKPVEQLIELVHGEGGVVIAAHPFKKLLSGGGYYGSGMDVYKYGIDGLETEHPSYDDESRDLAGRCMADLNIAGIGCSDSHELGTVGFCRTVFDREVTNVASICEEIRAGRVKAVNLARSSRPGSA